MPPLLFVFVFTYVMPKIGGGFMFGGAGAHAAGQAPHVHVTNVGGTVVFGYPGTRTFTKRVLD